MEFSGFPLQCDDGIFGLKTLSTIFHYINLSLSKGCFNYLKQTFNSFNIYFMNKR